MQVEPGPNKLTYPNSVDDPYSGEYNVSCSPGKQELGPESFRKVFAIGGRDFNRICCQLSAETMDFVFNHELAEATACLVMSSV